MVNEFSAVYEQDDEWFIGYCPEIPEANGQGKTLDECRKSLSEAVKLVLETHREDILKGIPPEAIKETISLSA